MTVFATLVRQLNCACEIIPATHYTLDRLPRLVHAFCSVLRHLLGSFFRENMYEVQDIIMAIKKPKGMQDIAANR